MLSAVAITARPQILAPGGYRAPPRVEEIPEESYLAALADRVDATPYELRARLAGGAPWFVARVTDPWEADAVCEWLRHKGFGAVVVRPEDLQNITVARGPLALGAEGLAMGPRSLPYARIAFIVDALCVAEQANERVEHVIVSVRGERLPQTADIASVRYAKERQRTLYLFDAEGGGVRLPQDLTRSVALPGLTSLARYEALCAALRTRAPHAGFDGRLVHAPRRRTSYEPRQHDRDHSSLRSDNLDETDLAARALHLASVEGQRA